MAYRGLKGARFTEGGIEHLFLLLINPEDDCHYFYHLKDGKVEGKVNLGTDYIAALITYESLVHSATGDI